MGMPCGGLASGLGDAGYSTVTAQKYRTEAAMRSGYVAMLALAFASAALAEQAPSWQTLKPDGEPFIIDMPGMAKEETMDMMDDPKAPLMAKTYTVETASGSAYVANCTVMPPAQAQKAQADAQGILAKVRDGSLKGMSAKLTSDKEITISGYPAREVTGETSDGLSSLSRMAVVGDRLCQAIAVVPAAKARSGDVRRFLDSLSFSAPK